MSAYMTLKLCDEMRPNCADRPDRVQHEEACRGQPRSRRRRPGAGSRSVCSQAGGGGPLLARAHGADQMTSAVHTPRDSVSRDPAEHSGGGQTEARLQGGGGVGGAQRRGGGSLLSRRKVSFA